MAERRVVVWSAVADVVAVLVFVAIGRRTHDETGNVVVGALKVAAPFVIALALGWVIARAWKSPWAPAAGVVIWLTTVIVGMLLRRFVFDRGTALPFIIVATLFTGFFLVGWRVVVEWRSERDIRP